MNLQWNVYYQSGKDIESFNIFEHYGLSEAFKKLLKKRILDKDEFAEGLRRVLSYYFWSKSEYEIVLTSWPPYIEQEEIDRINNETEEWFKKYNRKPFSHSYKPKIAQKIDVYDQIMLNWERFVDYVWANKGYVVRDEIKKS